MSAVRELDAEPLLRARAELGEGPRWDAAAGRLLWVDILAGTVHEHRPDGGGDRSWDVGRHVGAVAPTTDPDRLLLAVREGFAVLDPGGAVTPVAPVLADRPEQRMNDGGCDPAGRFWAGSMRYDARPGEACLYRLDEKGTVDTVLRGLGLANGLGWSADGRTMYFVDSLTQRVDAFAVDPGTGAVGDGRPVVVVPGPAGLPDGLAVDDEGYLWVALWGGSAVHRYAPDGRLDTVVRLPVTQVTSCTFAGLTRDRLVITTARDGLDAAERDRQRLAGAVFAVDPGISGPVGSPYVGIDRLPPSPLPP